jgi:hypothetical protein
MTSTIQSICRLVLSILLMTYLSLLDLSGQKVTVKIQFNNPPSTSTTVKPAVLKYNKDFAYSFALDDGRDDAYTLAFRLLNGGRSEVDNKVYPGLYYTNGCGKRIPFTAGNSWFTLNLIGSDLHFGTSSYLTYAQAIEMYQAGWEFYNHSYNHEANSPNIDYSWQLQQNHASFKANTGIDFRFCVPPSGDTLYISPAFSLGYQACVTSNYSYPGVGPGTILTQPIPTSKPVFWRNLVNSDDEDLAALKSRFDTWAASTINGNQKWMNDFTHRVLYERKNASLEFDAFKGYMEYLESRYGAGGTDNGLFASTAEVFDYLTVRDRVRISTKITGTQMEITLDYSNVPRNLRYQDVTLILGTINSINNVSILERGTVSYAGKGTYTMVNIDLPDSLFSGIDDSPLITGENKVKIYPNPSSGQVRIEFKDPSGIRDLQLFGMDGRFISVPFKVSPFGDITFDLGNTAYPSGVYYVRLLGQDNRAYVSRLLLVK